MMYADALKENMFFHEIDNESYAEEKDIDNAPTIDAVEVVRCKDCKHFHKNIWGSDIGIGRPYDCLIVGHCGCEFWGRKEDGSMTQTAEDAFCSFGERRSE